jgi:hypothetical protein
MANIIWVYATSRDKHSMLFKKIEDEIAARDNLRKFTPQGLSNVVWAFATADEFHPGMFRRVGDEIAACDELRTFET